MQKLPFQTGDARWGMLNNLIPPSALYVTVLNFRIFFPLHHDVMVKLLDLTVVNEESIQMALDDSTQYTKQAFIVTSQFQIENGLKHTLRGIAPTNTKDQFGAIAKDILGECGIQDVDLKHRMLNTPALIRNCLHTNGIHTKPHVTNVIKGVEYKFEQGKRFTCSHLSHVVHALSTSLDVLEEILLSDASKNVPRIIDPFTEQRSLAGINP